MVNWFYPTKQTRTDHWHFELTDHLFLLVFHQLQQFLVVLVCRLSQRVQDIPSYQVLQRVPELHPNLDLLSHPALPVIHPIPENEW